MTVRSRIFLAGVVLVAVGATIFGLASYLVYDYRIDAQLPTLQLSFGGLVGTLLIIQITGVTVVVAGIGVATFGVTALKDADKPKPYF